MARILPRDVCIFMYCIFPLAISVVRHSHSLLLGPPFSRPAFSVAREIWIKKYLSLSVPELQSRHRGCEWKKGLTLFGCKTTASARGGGVKTL